MKLSFERNTKEFELKFGDQVAHVEMQQIKESEIEQIQWEAQTDFRMVQEKLKDAANVKGKALTQKEKERIYEKFGLNIIDLFNAAFVKRLVRQIVSWDLEGSEGKTLPVTVANVSKIKNFYKPLFEQLVKHAEEVQDRESEYREALQKN